MPVIAFDLDDTLYPERMFALSGLRWVCAYLETEHGLDRDLHDRMLAIFDGKDRTRIFNEALDAAGYDYDEGLIRKLVDAYRTHPPRIRLYDDAKVVLSRLGSSADCRLGLITDGYHPAQVNKVNALDLATRIEKIVYTDQLGRNAWKPSPEGYLEIQKHFQVSGRECIYVGDNPQKDFVTAKKLGWTTVRVLRKDSVHTHRPCSSEWEAQHVVRSLVDAMQVFEAGRIQFQARKDKETSSCCRI